MTAAPRLARRTSVARANDSQRDRLDLGLRLGLGRAAAKNPSSSSTLCRGSQPKLMPQLAAAQRLLASELGLDGAAVQAPHDRPLAMRIPASAIH